KTAGNQSLTATDVVTGSPSGATVAVTPAAADSITLSGFPATTTAGAAQTFTVTAKDAYGNVATGYTGTVHLTSTDAQAVLPADYTFTATDAGVKQFTVTLKTAGPQSVTVTDALNPTITQSVSLTVTPGAVSAFLVDGFPTDTLVGDAHSFT